MPQPPRPASDAAVQVERLVRQHAASRRLQEILLAFTRRTATTLSLGTPLESLATDANTLLGTTRITVWLHDRRARRLIAAACSSGRPAAAAIAADGPEPPARGMRLERPHLDRDGGSPRLVAPLRGWRRALGTLILEGAPHGLDTGQYLDVAHDFARQLSGAIEHVQLLDDILQQRRLLEDTFNALADLVLVVDAEGRVAQTNEAFAARTGTPRGALINRPVEGLIGSELSAWVMRRAGGRTPPGVACRECTDATLGGTFAATLTPLITRQGSLAAQVLVLRDITARTALERERAALRERLGQSEKLAALGQFVAGVAHEMNNPLQGVLGHLELLMKTSEAARPIRPTLRHIYQEGERAARIVRDLLVFTGPRRVRQRAVRIERVLARALASRAAGLRRARIEVARDMAAPPPVVRADSHLLQQAFLNLLMNAEHAIEEARARREGPRRIELAIRVAEPGLVRTTVRDTGDGIPADVLPRVFDPFFTTKAVGQGSGLGLAIAYGIVQEHGGAIRAENAPGGGCVFTVDLPAVRPSRPIVTARV